MDVKSPPRTWVYSALALALGFILVWLYAHPEMNCVNAALFLQATELMLAGKRLYVDVMLITPPMILYLNVVPVLIAKFVACNSIYIFNLFTAALIAGSTWTLLHLDDSGAVPRWSALALPIGSVFAALAVHFGEREHLFILLFLPYFCLRWLGTLEGQQWPRLQFWLGFLCSVAACQKPHFFLLIAVLEIHLWLRARTVKPPLFALAVPPALYMIHFLFLPSDVSRAFWTEHVPLVVDRYYTFAFPVVAFTNACARSLFFLGFIWAGWRTPRPENTILLPLGWAGLAALSIAVYQGMGFSYHFMLLDFLLLFGLPIFLRTLRERWVLLPAAALSLAAIVSLLPSAFAMQMAADRRDVLAGLEAMTKPGDTIAMFNSNITALYPPLLLRGLQPGTRYLNYFPLGFYNNTPARRSWPPHRYVSAAELEPGEKVFVERIIADLRLNKPRWLWFLRPEHFVDLFVPQGFDAFEYFKSTGILDAVKDLYELKAEDGKFIIYAAKGA